jgi:hypothetical protein
MEIKILTQFRPISLNTSKFRQIIFKNCHKLATKFNKGHTLSPKKFPKISIEQITSHKREIKYLNKNANMH